MAVALLRRLAAQAPVPLFAAIGRNGSRPVADLARHPGVCLESSPRHAAVLLVAGELRAADLEDLRRLHDQIPHPRATLWWGTAVAFPHGETLPTTANPFDAVRALYGALMEGRRETEPDLLPDEPPTPWRGKGDYGQGGEGMMGGTPYGRPMPMTGDDLRDGLSLDAYAVCVGPFLPMLPPGLQLQVTLQGDVIQSAKVRRAPHPPEPEGRADAARRRLAVMLRLLGLPAVATRRDTCRLARRLGALAAIPPGLGLIGGTDVRERLVRWCAEAADRLPAPVPAPEGRLVDLLPGLEWHEAVLVLNSFDPETLLRLAPEEPDKKEEKEEDANGESEA